jgi:hypothetical protein
VSSLTVADILAAGNPDKLVPEIGWRHWRVEWGPDEYRGIVTEEGVEKDFAHGLATLHHAIYSPSLVLLSGWRTLWPKRRELVARCPLAHDHFSPDRGCACGIHALRKWGNYSMRASHLPNGWAESFVVQRVFGEVYLWGKVVPGTRGWRAEFAYPRRLYVPAIRYARGPRLPAEEIVHHLADYGVPVHVVRTAEEVRAA